ncbi:MAG: hypothetical protein K8E66_06850, partial [Phycisphaerales bacterium]|nr:hypothetical protein [Phycisphaerales bacterium]
MAVPFGCCSSCPRGHTPPCRILRATVDRKHAKTHRFLPTSGYDRVNGGEMHELSIATSLIEIAEESA